MDDGDAGSKLGVKIAEILTFTVTQIQAALDAARVDAARVDAARVDATSAAEASKPETPKRVPCVLCGNAPEFFSDGEGSVYHRCGGNGCDIFGPSGDPDGVKWDALMWRWKPKPGVTYVVQGHTAWPVIAWGEPVKDNRYFTTCFTVELAIGRVAAMRPILGEPEDIKACQSGRSGEVVKC